MESTLYPVFSEDTREMVKLFQDEYRAIEWIKQNEGNGDEYTYYEVSANSIALVGNPNIQH